jgi:hypothetical protein
MSKIRDILEARKPPSREEIDKLLHNVNRAANAASDVVVYLNNAARKSKLKRNEVKRAMKMAVRTKGEIFDILEDMLDVVTAMKREAGEL